MATSRIETKVIPVTETLLVEDTLRSTLITSSAASQPKQQRWFMPEARSAIQKNLMLIYSEDVTHGRVI